MDRTYHSTDLDIATTTSKTHPASAEILAAAMRTSKALGIYTERFYGGHHTMTTHIFHDADVERAVIATVWFSTLYYLDDLFGEDMRSQHPPPALEDLSTAWARGRWDDAGAPLLRAVAHCSHQIQTRASEAFFLRYTAHLHQHLQHTLRPPDYTTVEEYVDSRIHFGGMYPTIGMIEFVKECYVPPELLACCPALQPLLHNCVLIGVLSNDLISYHKEKHSTQNLLNAYLRTGTARDLHDAIQMGLQRVNACYAGFLQSAIRASAQAERLNHAERRAVQAYIAGLEQLVAASYHWQVSTNRYRAHDNIFADLTRPLAAAQ